MSKICLVTGSSGLIGSEVTKFFHENGFAVHGVDNNQRETFFGPQGNTRWNQQRLIRDLPRFSHHELDIRDRAGVLRLVETLKPSVIVHTAAQPSHDLAARIPFDDFDVNAVGTLNLVESAFGRHRAGVRTLLQHAHLLSPWWMSDRSQSQRRRTARIPELPD